ncbi:hypothetical protein [Ulvibacter antarcticus]|uniref:Lipocalin-like protein n=1 Tax=Ulvibacter antarcticus TaxID=442714 RepID=A0A3L9YVG6_9FLAO|nr:hypothetical protein [Ulvibacter antarcticus]RMA64314.1 hypothetical protein BXY75_1187 [Ulvibacter antarcticus]
MKTLAIVFKKSVFAIVIGLLFFACKSDSGTEDIGTIFIGIFDNTWEVQGVDNYSFGIFRDGSIGTTSGILFGNEDHPNSGSIDMINGTFDGLNLAFTIPRTNGNVVFTGVMTPTSETDHTIIRIDLSSSEGENLVLFTN